MDKVKPKPWYLRKELYGAIITSLTPTLLLFPQHTVAFKVGISLNGIAGGILAYLGIVKGFQGNNLWKPVQKTVEMIDRNLPKGLRKE